MLANLNAVVRQNAALAADLQHLLDRLQSLHNAALDLASSLDQTLLQANDLGLDGAALHLAGLLTGLADDVSKERNEIKERKNWRER